MTPSSVREYAAAMRPRYRAADRVGKGTILTEFCLVTGYHRKSAVRLLRHGPKESPRPRGRQREYGLEVAQALNEVWVISDYLCSKRLQPFLPELLKKLEGCEELHLSQTVRAQLLALSPATIDRLLQPFRQQHLRQPHSSSHSSSSLKALVPIRTFADWDQAQMGYLEVDLVAHCGESTEGFYLNTLDSVDIVTGWTELVVIWGKSQDRVGAGIDNMRRHLPFPLLGIDCDNGGEFLNQGLYDYCGRHHIELTRSRPYKKNDQAHVEQRNWTTVRRPVGYDRYASKKAYAQMQELYRLLRLHFNYLQPMRKLVAKERVNGRVKKRYDEARTPYQRVLATKELKPEKVEELRKEYESLNPVQLHKEIEAALEKLWALREGADAKPQRQ